MDISEDINTYGGCHVCGHPQYTLNIVPGNTPDLTCQQLKYNRTPGHQNSPKRNIIGSYIASANDRLHTFIHVVTIGKIMVGVVKMSIHVSSQQHYPRNDNQVYTTTVLLLERNSGWAEHLRAHV